MLKALPLYFLSTDETLSPHGKNDVLIPVLCIGFLLAALGLGMVTYKHKKGKCLLLLIVFVLTKQNQNRIVLFPK